MRIPAGVAAEAFILDSFRFQRRKFFRKEPGFTWDWGYFCPEEILSDDGNEGFVYVEPAARRCWREWSFTDGRGGYDGPLSCTTCLPRSGIWPHRNRARTVPGGARVGAFIPA